MSDTKLLIDGYNVLFQSDLVGKGRGRNWLSSARQRLLQLLSSSLDELELSKTLVVFDAPKFGPVPEQTTFASGLRVVYAVDHAEADDLLEETIRQHPTPTLLRVVSSDQRIRRCARARRADSVDSQAFLDSLSKREPLVSPAPSPSDAGNPQLSTDEIAFWLRVFDEKSPSSPDEKNKKT